MKVLIICLSLQKDAASLASTNVNHHVTKVDIISFVLFHVIWILLYTWRIRMEGFIFSTATFVFIPRSSNTDNRVQQENTLKRLK